MQTGSPAVYLALYRDIDVDLFCSFKPSQALQTLGLYALPLITLARSGVVRSLDVHSDLRRRSAMPTPETTRTARVEARIAPEALAVVRRAAELQGRSVSDFLVAAALKDAQRTIEDAQIIRLSLDDQQRFADLLLSPSPLAPAMKRAIKARKRLISSAP